MNNVMPEPFQEDLLKNEKILWAGQPEPKVLFTRSDFFLVPFSILWFAFAAFWMIHPVVLLIGLPFVLFGFYLFVGRFFYKVLRKKRTYYAVTDKRVLILTKLFGKSLKAVYTDSIPVINKSVRSDGIGTITFGKSTYMRAMYQNSGLEFFGWGYGEYMPAFYDIAGANEVFKMVSELMDKSEPREF